MKIAITGAIAATTLALAVTTGARAETLKFAHPLSNTHYAYEQGLKQFTDAVTAKTNGEVTFDVYPSNQLGKDYLTLLSSGLVDVAMIVPAYAADKFPLSSVTELPGLYGTSCEGTDMSWAMMKPGGVLDQQELAPLGIRVLFAEALTPNSFMTISKKVETLDDAAGLKIYANGAAMDKAIRALGAVPVTLTAAELYDSMTRGTVDGAGFPYASAAQYKLDSVVHYAVNGTRLGATIFLVAISDRAWSKLSEPMQQALTEAGAEAQQHLCTWLDADLEKTRSRFETEHGHVVTTLSPEQQALWAERLDTVADAWVTEMDAAGKDGTGVLAAMRSAAGTQ